MISLDSSLASSSEVPQGSSEAEESPQVRDKDIIDFNESPVNFTEDITEYFTSFIE